jgi:hypothetical protein
MLSFFIEKNLDFLRLKKLPVSERYFDKRSNCPNLPSSFSQVFNVNLLRR